MRITVIVLSLLLGCLLSKEAGADTARKQTIVRTSNGDVLVESFGGCGKAHCPTVLILSGSKGFLSPAYDAIGRTFRAAGLDANLIHILSRSDFDAIATQQGSRGRIAYYKQRLNVWTSIVQDVSAYFKAQKPDEKLGVLGISLGAQIAATASFGYKDIDALVLVDGGLPTGYSKPPHQVPPLHLIWGSDDQTFPLSIAKNLQAQVKELGTPVTIDVYQGGSHDFFLKPDTHIAPLAYASAANFFRKQLSQ